MIIAMVPGPICLKNLSRSGDFFINAVKNLLYTTGNKCYNTIVQGSCWRCIRKIETLPVLTIFTILMTWNLDPRGKEYLVTWMDPDDP